jgi:YjbE family integral membrane protein
MFYDEPHFWVALLEIIGVNIVLSGDNAVVIALAARSLPAKQRRQAVLWGSAAAVVLRIILTIVAVELLRLPYLKFIGAGLLVWIGIQLLLPEDDGENFADTAKTGMLAAIRTILIADLVMSLDNVIAVAAAAKGSIPLLVLGLLISIPLIIFGSTLLMKVMERWPIIITIGGALLGWVAGEMAVSDPAAKDWIDANAAWLHTALPALGAILVVASGKWLAMRAAAAEPGSPAVDLAQGAASRVGTPTTASSPLRCLLAADDSDASIGAVERFLAQMPVAGRAIEIHLLNVQPPVSRGVSGFVDEDRVRNLHREEGEKALGPVRARLDRAGVPYVTHIGVGDPGDVIVQFAQDQGASRST